MTSVGPPLPLNCKFLLMNRPIWSISMQIVLHTICQISICKVLERHTEANRFFRSKYFSSLFIPTFLCHGLCFVMFILVSSITQIKEGSDNVDRSMANAVETGMHCSSKN